MPGHPASSRPDRILDASLKLFNEHGFQNITARQIAQHLGMSAGHLAYHFKGKIDIVTAVFPLLEKEIREAKKPEGPFLAADAASHQIGLFRTMWRYRFFFNALTQLLTHDARLRERFMNLQNTVIETLSDLFDELIAQNFMRPVTPPNSTRMIARSCWMIWLSWLRFEQIAYPRRRTVRNAGLYDGVMQNFCVVEPYFSKRFAEAMLEEVRKALPDEGMPTKRRRKGKPKQQRA
jgi:AcrR family transcriptional regulator